ncbi:MAG: carbonic anhydrase [Planctomycetes bacterium]|nr:carbonic anhydrase [Planctomycetota bacterium]
MMHIQRTVWTLTIVLCCAGLTHAQDAKPTPASALQRLKDGNARFVADQNSKRDVGAKKRAELAKGQHPFAVVLTCADSRLAPELIFDTGLGDLFVLRVGGNIADPAVVGSIEYAVEHLHAPLIVVLGHESCGAVSAAINGKPDDFKGDLGWLIKQVKVGDLPADADKKMAAGVANNARAAAADIELRSKIIHEEVKEKKVMIVSGVYSLKTGKIDWLSAPQKKKIAEKIEAPKSVKLDTIPGPSLPIVVDPRWSSVEQPARFPRLRSIFQRWR